MKYIDRVYRFIFKEPFKFLGPSVMAMASLYFFLFIANEFYGDGTQTNKRLITGGFIWGYLAKDWSDRILDRFKRINEEEKENK